MFGTVTEPVDLANKMTEPVDADAGPVIDNDVTTCIRLTAIKSGIRTNTMEYYTLKTYILPQSNTVLNQFTVAVSGKYLTCTADNTGILTKASDGTGCDAAAGTYTGCAFTGQSGPEDNTQCTFSCTQPNLVGSRHFAIVYLRLAYFADDTLAEMCDVKIT